MAGDGQWAVPAGDGAPRTIPETRGKCQNSECLNSDARLRPSEAPFNVSRVPGDIGTLSRMLDQRGVFAVDQEESRAAAQFRILRQHSRGLPGSPSRRTVASGTRTSPQKC